MSAMSEKHIFDVIFRGKLTDGVTKEHATHLLGRRLKISPVKAFKVVSTPNCRIAKNVELDKAKAIRDSFEQCGLVLMIVYVDTIIEKEEVLPLEENHPEQPVPEENLPQVQEVGKESNEKSSDDKSKDLTLKIIVFIVVGVLIYFAFKYFKMIMIIMAFTGAIIPAWLATANASSIVSRLIQTLFFGSLLFFLFMWGLNALFSLF